jgi:hypothetical protein
MVMSARRPERDTDSSVTAARIAMNENSADFVFIDVAELQLDELLSRPDDAAFQRALNRILYSRTGDACNGFQANI